MSRLIVYLNDVRSGTLEQDKSGLISFIYDQTWLDNPKAIPLSRSLPLQPDPFSGNKARPFFAGILPEEGPRIKIAAILGISEKNDYAMLERIGGECAGAVSLLPEDAAPPKPGETSQREISDAELRDIIKQLPQKPLMAGTEGLRLSLAGAQDKLPVIFTDGKFALPLGNTPSTHILKPEPERFPGLAANEFYCMTLARQIGLKAADVQYIDIAKTPCILIERYDRTIDAAGRRERIHQEDFCQALGFPPEKKYQAEGGPLLRDCITLLRDWSTTPALELRDFIDGLIYNMIIGNADAHAKNYSMLYPGNKKQLAPLYDLVCTVAWDELTKTPSMKIGKCKNINNLLPGHWEKMADETGLGWPMIRDRIVELTSMIPDHTTTAGQDLPASAADMLKRVADIITSRSKTINPA